jgi:hypothetical protein
MPIRVLLNGQNIIAPLDEKEWDNLQERVRSKEIELHLPCCQGLAYPRVSPRGAQHFVHFVNTGCTPESETHLLAKLEIIKACRKLGYDAIPEFCGDGWRADVLVRSAKWSCCFEVQASPQTFQETIRRQETYKNHDLRCCWLFRHLPERQALNLEQVELLSQHATPMFRFSERLPRRVPPNFDVEVNGTERPLGQFVEDLLRRKLRYSASRAVDGLKAVVQLWRTNCPECGYTMHFFELDDLLGQAECGANIRFGNNRYSLLYPASYRPLFDFYMTRIPSEIREFLRVESPAGQAFSEFVCTGCGKTRLSERPGSSRARLKRLTRLQFTTGPGTAPEIFLNHWCDSPLCRLAQHDPPGEIQDALSRTDLDWCCAGISGFERKIDYKQRLPYRHFAAYRA